LVVLDVTLLILSIRRIWTLDLSIEILDLCHFMCNCFGFRFNCDKFKDVTGLILRLIDLQVDWFVIDVRDSYFMCSYLLDWIVMYLVIS